MAIITRIEVQCDVCHKLIPKDEKCHQIQWHDSSPDAEYVYPMKIDLCHDCYYKKVKQDLALYSYTKE